MVRTNNFVNTVSINGINLRTIFLKQVFEDLTQLKSDPASGPDLIPAIFLNACQNSLIYSVHKLFSLSLKLGIFPDLWKFSFVKPIWKAGGRSNRLKTHF